MFSNILVPTDGSDLSKKAVGEALTLAKATKGKVTALHIYPKFVASPYGNFGPSEDVMEEAHRNYQRAESEKLFDAIRASAKSDGVPVETLAVEANDVYKEIVSAAERSRCDLICMASHGRRGMAGMLLGSETQKVLTHSKIPVLVLR